MSRISPKGRFIYAVHKTMARSNEALLDMCSAGEMTLGEAEQEIIRDHRGRQIGVAITIEA